MIPTNRSINASSKCEKFEKFNNNCIQLNGYHGNNNTITIIIIIITIIVIILIILIMMIMIMIMIMMLMLMIMMIMMIMIIWGNCSSTLEDKLVKFQKRAARVILDCDCIHHPQNY